MSSVFSVLCALCLVGALALGFFLAYIVYNKKYKEEKEGKSVPNHHEMIEDEE